MRAPAPPRPGPALADLLGWRWLPCGCSACYHTALTWFTTGEVCPAAKSLEDRRVELVFADLDPDQPSRLSFEDQLAHTVIRADAWYAVMDHYGPDPRTDPGGAARWASAVRARLPRYGFTPSGRPIHTTGDPDYGRARCVCGFAWADRHPPGDGTGCPEHLRPGRSAGSPADLLYRARYAEQLTRWHRQQSRSDS